MKTSSGRNIGIVLSLFRPGGGTYQWTINILHVLEEYRKDRQCRIHVFYALESDEHRKIYTQFSDFEYHRISKPEIFLSKVLTKVLIAAPFLINCLRPMYPLNALGRKNDIDLMVFPGANFHTCFYERKQLFMFCDIAHVFYPHFPEVSVRGELRRRHILFTDGIRQADAIAVDSNQLRQDIVKYYQADIAKVEVLYQTISQTVAGNPASDKESLEFTCQLPGKYLFYPAQLWAHKNHLNLLRAMAIVVQEHKDLVLVISGSDKEGSDKIFSLIKELKMEDHVQYRGYVPDQDMAALYKNAQMLIMPTYFGPTNIPTLEAFHFGCPAVISDLPGVREQTGDAALLFDPDSPEDMAAKISSVLNGRELREDMVRQGHARMDVLSFENYKIKLFEILDKQWQ